MEWGGDEQPFDTTDVASQIRRSIDELENGERLFEGSPISGSLALCQLFRWGYGAGVSHRNLDTLLQTIHQLLPHDNTLPTTVREAVHKIKPLRQGHRVVDVCRKDCCSFEGPLASATECPHCSLPRYKPGGGKKSYKTYYRWSLAAAAALKFLTPESAQKVTAHNRLQSRDGVVRSIHGKL